MQNQVKVERNLLAIFIIASRSSRDIDEREVGLNLVIIHQAWYITELCMNAKIKLILGKN